MRHEGGELPAARKPVGEQWPSCWTVKADAGGGLGLEGKDKEGLLSVKQGFPGAQFEELAGPHCHVIA